MALIPAILVLFLSIHFTSSFVLSNDEQAEIVWPTEYSFEFETFDFISTLRKTFKVWYSAEQNRSRIDTFGGTTKQFFYADEGLLYQVFPKTDSDMKVEIACWQANFSSEEPMPFLPYASSFNYTGESIILFDKLVDVWTSNVDMYGKPVQQETLYVFKTPNGIDIPVQYISKSFSLTTGVVKESKITNFYDFKDSVAKEDLMNEVENCEEPEPQLVKNEAKFFSSVQLDIVFESYANYHNNNYKEQERQVRKCIFENNYRMVQEHNRKNLPFKMELNSFSDWTPSELKYLTGTTFSKQVPEEALPFPHTLEEINEIVGELPQNFDLRLEGVITPVKHQGQCGSCWAFATTATVEGAIARDNGDRLLDLSEQSLVDCAWSEGAYGCDGVKELTHAWKYVVRSGIPTEREYGTYLEEDGICHIANMSTVYKIQGFARVTPRNPEALKVALYKYGPVTVGVEVTKSMFFYSSGLFYDPSCDPSNPSMNHAVTVVGYGTRDGEDYWIIKNSWGENYGEDGYILMSAKNNNCFILDEAYYAVV